MHVELLWFSRSGSLRSISHAIRRPPHTSQGLRLRAWLGAYATASGFK